MPPKGKNKKKQQSQNVPSVAGLTISDEGASSSNVSTSQSGQQQMVTPTSPQAPQPFPKQQPIQVVQGGSQMPTPVQSQTKPQVTPSVSIEMPQAQAKVATDDSKKTAIEESGGMSIPSSRKPRKRNKKQTDESSGSKMDPITSEITLPTQAPQQLAPQQYAPRQQGPPQQHAPGQQGPPQSGPQQYAPGKFGPPQQGPQQYAPRQQGPPQQGPRKYAPRQQGPPQSGPQQYGPGQFGPPQQGFQPYAPRQQGPPQKGPQQHAPQQVQPQQSQPSLSQPSSSTSSRTSSVAPVQKTQTVGFQEERRAREMDAISKCRFKIPGKIIGNSVRATNIRVLVNYLSMDVKPIKVYRYDVGVKPDRPKKMVPIAFNAFFQAKFPRVLVAYDQNKNFYSPKKLPGVTDQDRLMDNVTVKDPNGKEMHFEVSIKATGDLDLGILLEYMKSGTSLNPPTEVIQCIDVILRQGSLTQYVKAGRTYFRRPREPLRLGDGLEMWTGLFQSAIFTSRPWINIDVAHKGFPIHQPVLKLLEEFRLDPRQALSRQRGVENLENMLRGLKISAFLGGDRNVRRELICNGLGQPADQQMFALDDPSGKTIKISVADYFSKVKKIRLQMPYMNCLWLGPRDKSIFYPLELCDVAYGQVLNKQLNDRQLSTMVKEAATPPDIRQRKIQEVISAMDFTRNIYFKEFGLSVSDKFTEIQAKILQPPRIKYQDKAVNVNQGVWWSSRMLSGAQIRLWSIIAIERDVRAVNGENLIKFLQDQSRQMGIQMDPPQNPLYNVPLRDLEAKLSGAKKFGMQIVIVVVPMERGPRNTYSEIKKIAERTVGVLTQCVREQTLQRINPQTAKNILLKINAKMTGINHSLDGGSVPACLKRGGVMVIGADVTHPSPDQINIPSIAAVTASMDPACFVYSLGMSIQTPKQETILEFEDIMVEHLQTYRKRQNVLPTKLYVFRDGVSEGQFAMILNTELVALYNAYRRVSGSEKKPEVMILLVQKRHHTRLFVPNDRVNVSPGTVVDTEITHPRELDFYLVSHAAIKGTARPTRYYCVRNDGSMPSDEVEQLAYYLCHLYSRCSRAVSYPTPTYYAHLACLRARVLTLGEKFNNANLEKQPQRLRILDNMQQLNPMFFV